MEQGGIMKGKVYVVSKTHLDLGYTDLADKVLEKYICEYIPKAIEIAKEVNRDSKKFVWTLGSWLIKKGLEDKDEQRAKRLYDACKRGDIVAHALPFTVQSEILDERLANDMIEIIKDLDKEFGRKTVTAKMTDVPGHTSGLVKVLADNGIKLLHIGVNKSSAVPCVPPVFVWKNRGKEVIVVYEGSYGGVVRTPYIDDILVFDHSMDNCGPRNAKKVLRNFQRLKRRFRDYEVVAGTLDDYAEVIWKVKDKLPVIESEIGDSWIHGVASDPYKYGGLIALQKWREKAVLDKRIDTSEKWYKDFSDCLMCVAEHTSGLGVLRGFKDYDNYERKNFEEALEKDKRIKRYGIYSLPCMKKLAEKTAKKGVYSAMEDSWREQREYLDKAIDFLPDGLKEEAKEELDKLRPVKAESDTGEKLCPKTRYMSGKWTAEFNDCGAPRYLAYDGKELIKENNLSLIEYISLSPDNYAFWLKHYQRDLYKTFTWAIPDFGRPKLKKAKYIKGNFEYRAGRIFRNGNKITVHLRCDNTAYETLGMPFEITADYTFCDNRLQLNIAWYDKKANRLPEEIWLHLPFEAQDDGIRYKKLGVVVSPYDVVKNGGRNLSVTENVLFVTGSGLSCDMSCGQCAPVSLGKGKLLKYDNIVGDGSQGFSYLLYNNVWGTNYPLWYRDNAAFSWILEIKD